MDVIHNPENHLHISEIWAFVSVDDKGDEGVCGFYDSVMGCFVAMVCADQLRIAQLMPMAKKLAAANTGKQIKLVKFSTRTEVEVITP